MGLLEAEAALEQKWPLPAEWRLSVAGITPDQTNALLAVWFLKLVVVGATEGALAAATP